MLDFSSQQKKPCIRWLKKVSVTWFVECNNRISFVMNNQSRFLFTVSMIIICMALASGCSRVVNKPVNTFPKLVSHQAAGAHPQAASIAVRTSFANGSKSIHFERSRDISEKVADLLNEGDLPGIVFFPVGEFDDLDEAQFDYLLRLNCKTPEHKTKRSPLIILGYPATISIAGAPLGLLVLSWPGMVKELATFEWDISIVPRGYETFQLKKKTLKPQEAKVNSSAWSTSQEKMLTSYRNADSHVIAAAIDFVNELNWRDLNSRTAAYAKTHYSSAESKKITQHSIDALRPTQKGTDRPGPMGSHYAVVIGISKYKYADESKGFGNLLYADDDAKAIAELFRRNGWPQQNIKTLIDETATKRNIQIALESWLTKVRSNDLILLFWAGHGYPDPEDPQKVYFACYDTDISIPSTGFRMDRVRDFLEERKARNVVLLADTCHAGKLITRGERGVAVMPYIQKTKHEDDLPEGWVFMVGADTDRQAIENSSWRNGAFTHCLIDALQGKADGYEGAGYRDRIISLGELKAYLLSAMPEETLKVLGVARHPIIATSSGSPLIWDLPLVE